MNSSCKIILILLVLLLSSVSIMYFATKHKGQDSRLNVAIPNPIENFSPISAITVQEKYMLPLVYESLFFENKNGEIKSMLAESWEYSEADKKLNITIHHSRFFSDNTEVESKHAVESFKYYCSKSLRPQSWMVGIVGCSKNSTAQVWATGKYSLTILLQIDPSAFLYQLASSTSAVLNVKSENEIIGSGLYQLKFKNRSKIVLTSNQYNPLEKKLLYKSIEFKHVSESKIHDAMKNIRFDIFSMYLSSSVSSIPFEYQVIDHAPRVSQLLILNEKKYPFSIKTLRQSLATEIENADFSTCQLNSIRAVGILPKGVGGSFNLNEGNELSQQRTSTHFSLEVATDINFYRHIERKNKCEENLLKEIFLKHNIRLNIIHLNSYDDLIPKFLSENISGYIELFVFGSRDPYHVLRYLESNENLNFFHYSSDSVDKNLKESLVTKKITDRFKYYKLINKEIFINSNAMPLYYIGHINVVKKNMNMHKFGKNNGYLYNPNSFLYLIQYNDNTGD